MKKNKLIGASLALALGTGLLAQPAYANAELESDLQKASELTESMKNHKVEVDKIRRGKSEEKPNDNETPSTPSKDDNDNDLTGGALEGKGYDSKEEAEKAGEKALKNSPNKKSYSVSKGVDGKYYFHLWEDSENTKDNNKNKQSKEDTSKNKENNKQVANNSSNVKTGIEPLIGTAGVLVASIGALGFSKKEDK